MNRRMWALWMVGCFLLMVGAPVVNAQMPTLGGVLEAGEVLKEGAGKILDALSLVHRPVLQLGHEMTLQAIYEPEDATDAIHLKHDPNDPPEKRRIRLEAIVEFNFDLEKQLPAATVRELAGLNFPERGRVEKVPVRFWIPEKLLNYTELRARDWDGVLPTWWKYTDAMGVAAPYIYPLVDQPLGGIRKVAEVEVRAQAMVQHTQGIPLDAVALGAIVGEEIASPTEARATVRVEYHEPTEWEGTVTVSRSVLGSSRFSAPPKSEGARVTLKTANSLAQSTLSIPKVRLNKEGIGTGDYEYNLELLGSSTTVTTARIEGKVYTDTIARDMEGHGEEYGDALVEIWVDPSTMRYAVIIRAAGAGSQALGIGMSRSGTEVHEWTDQDGSHSMTNPYEGLPENALPWLLILPGLLRQPTWQAFDPDATELVGFTSWTDNRSAVGHQFEVETTIEWNLHRIQPKKGRG